MNRLGLLAVALALGVGALIVLFGRAASLDGPSGDRAEIVGSALPSSPQAGRGSNPA